MTTSHRVRYTLPDKISIFLVVIGGVSCTVTRLSKNDAAVADAVAAFVVH